MSPDADAAHKAARRERTRLPPGTLLDGRYRIGNVLGDGGFATVYRAVDTHLHDREVALKVLIASEFAIGDFDVGEFEMRFRREARATAQLEHPNLATIYGSGLAQNHLYIAMELFEGHGLDDELRLHGPIDPQRAIALLLPALDALGQAHAAGVVHRDIKPSNLFLSQPHTADERLVILDFGVARLEDTELVSKLTHPGQVLGTPSYTAPEALKADITLPACDVYSFGLILLEMLTAQRAVDADSIYATMALHVSGDFRVPRDLLEGPLGPILNRALAPDPEDRFRDGRALYTALDSVDPTRVRLDLDAPRLPLSTLRDSGRIPPMPSEVVARLTSTSTPAIHRLPTTLTARPPRPSTPATNPSPPTYNSGHIDFAAMSAALHLDALKQQQELDNPRASLGTLLFVAVAVLAALAILGAVLWFGFLNR